MRATFSPGFPPRVRHRRSGADPRCWIVGMARATMAEGCPSRCGSCCAFHSSFSSKRTLSAIQLRWLSSSSSADDPYERYRRGLTADLLKELQSESASTISSLKRGLYQQVYQEIEKAAALNEHLINQERSTGPTGRYLYQWSTQFDPSSSGTPTSRIYQRHHVDQHPSKQSTQPQCVLEVNPTFDLIDMSLSVDERLLAYLVDDRRGGGRSQIWVRDIENGTSIRMDGLPHQDRAVTVEFGPPRINECEATVSHPLFYVATDSHGRPDRVYATTINLRTLFDNDLGNNQSPLPSAKLVYHSDDPTVHVDVQRTKGCKFVAINCRTQSSNEVYLLEHEDDIPKLVRMRRFETHYHVDVGSDNDVFVLASTSKDSELKLFQCSIRDLPLNETLETFLSGSAYATTSHAISDFDIFRNFIALYERSVLDGKQRIRVVNRQLQGEEWIVPNQEDLESVAMLSPGGNMNFNSSKVAFFVECPTKPRRTYEYNMMTRDLMIPHAQTFSEAEFVQRRIMVSSKDGTLVPLSIVYRSEDAISQSIQNDAAKAVLIGYGAYGEPMNLAFDPFLQPLLDRGFVLAFAHTRGGGDLGRSWHHRGRRREKFRAVEDFLACAEALASTILSRPVHLAIKGFSAGGVLVGAAANQRPELFQSVVLTNAFLDVDATLRNRFLPLTEHEWEEYGNPLEGQASAQAIARYCPTLNANNNTCGENTPKFLVIGTLDDDRVPFWNAVVYAKKKRSHFNERTNVFLHVEGEGGHHLGKNRVRVAAMEATFLIQHAIEN